MPLAQVEGHRIRIETEFRDKDLVEKLPGRAWDKEDRVWRVPLSWASCVQLRGVFGDRLGVAPDLAAWARNEIETRIAPCMALRVAEDADIPYPDLFPYQRAGAAFLAAAGSALLGDEMGLGKTVETITALELTNGYPALIVAPNSVKRGWRREFEQWAPHRDVVMVDGGAAKRRKQLAQEADAYIINWEGLKLHSRLAPFGYIKLSDAEKEPKELNAMPLVSIVADEAHRAKSPQAKQTRALWWLGLQARHRFALTGTPVANTPEDLWAIMHFVDPTEWPGKVAFIERYAMSSWNAFGFNEIIGLKGEHKDELFSFLDPRFIRRTKAQVMPQLPPKILQERVIELKGKQRKAYDQLRQHMMAELDDGVLMATNPLARMTRLLQLASAYGEFDENGDVILAEPSSKIDDLLDVISELGDRQALVFAESRQLIELAAARLEAKAKNVTIGQVTGAVTGDDRERAVLDFQEGRTQVLLLTMGAGGEGLNLAQADVEIFLQRSYSAVKDKQAEDRGYGRGADQSGITIIDIIAEDTVEDRIREVLREKAGKLEEVVRDGEALRRCLTK